MSRLLKWYILVYSLTSNLERKLPQGLQTRSGDAAGTKNNAQRISNYAFVQCLVEIDQRTQIIKAQEKYNF